MTSGGLAAVSSSAFAALYSAFGKYDVVHIHAEGPAFFAWLPKMFGKRVVVTVHGIDWQREKWQSGLGSKFIHQGEKNAAKYADEVIVLSKAGRGDQYRNHQEAAEDVLYQHHRRRAVHPHRPERYCARGSKYIQSKLGDTFKSVKTDLDAKKSVLFSGTSCQVAGLKKYIGKEYDNLFCVDIVCHGVPSKKIWEAWLLVSVVVLEQESSSWSR